MRFKRFSVEFGPEAEVDCTIMADISPPGGDTYLESLLA